MRLTPRCLLALPALLPLVVACGDTPGADPASVTTDAPLLWVEPENPRRPYFQDLGRVEHGSRHLLQYRMLNAGERDVIVERIDPACQCSRISRIGYESADGAWIPGDPSSLDRVLVLPGGAELEFTVAVDTAFLAENRDFLEIVRFYTNATSVEERNPLGGIFDIEYHIFGEKLFLLNPPNFRIGEIPMGAGGGNQMTIQTGLAGMRGRIVDVHEHSPELEVELRRSEAHTEPFWHLAVSLPAGLPKGAWSGFVTLRTSDADGEGDAGRLQIPITAQVVDDIRIVPQMLNLGRVQAGAPGTLRADLHVLVPGQRVRVQGATLTGPSAEHLTVDYEPLRADDQGRDLLWKLTVTCAADTPPGPVRAELELQLDDDVTPTIRARVLGAVQ